MTPRLPYRIIGFLGCWLTGQNVPYRCACYRRFRAELDQYRRR